MNGLGYKRISDKYDIAIATARNWIRKARQFNNELALTDTTSKAEFKLNDVTQSIKEPTIVFSNSAEQFEIELNGNNLKLNSASLKAVIEVLKMIDLFKNNNLVNL